MLQSEVPMMEESLKNSFKKGLSTLAVLSLLYKNRMYGYELVQAMSKLSGGDFTMRETALYPVLYRLENQGMLTSEKIPEGKRRLRVYYQLTPKGEAYLKTIRAEYDSINGGLLRILQQTKYAEPANDE